jgi:cobaltochelatase CobN
MHRLAVTPGGWNPQTDGVIIVEQTPAPLVLLAAADTDIQTLASAAHSIGADFPPFRVANLLQFSQQLTIDTYAAEILSQARVIILRILGGKSYWSYGLEVVKETVRQTDADLIILPGDDRPDPDLMSHSTVPLTVVNRVWRYFVEGGIENLTHALEFIADTSLGCQYHPPLPVVVPRVGRWNFKTEGGGQQEREFGKVAILFYRAHYLAGNTAPIEALCAALARRQLEPVPIFVSSLRDAEVQAELEGELESVQLILNTTGFAVGTGGEDSLIPGFPDVPVLQVILSTGTEEHWENQWMGLLPRDMAMNVALPEVDGRIITRAISFKIEEAWNDRLETSIVVYQPRLDRVEFVAELAKNWVKLCQTTPQHRPVALILANYPNKNGRLANGVGLDTPASCVEILKALKQAGYQISDIPETGDELIARLTSGVTNDPESWELRSVFQYLSREDYQDYFATLPPKIREGIETRWGKVKDIPMEKFPISGIQLGNIFVGIQPSRGYDRDPSLNYHAPDLEPTHDYLAFYYWLRKQFQAQAIVHVGKHGNLEWLPGKSVALSENCYPEIALGAMPHFYPFIVNDPGEGSQAKRRAQAVIIDHLTPPMTRAELYGSLQQLEALVDEYYEAQSLNPVRLPDIRDRIVDLILTENLHRDLGISDEDFEKSKVQKNQSSKLEILDSIDGYLCDLKEAQIRDGLHIFGQCPQGRQLRDLIVAIARFPGVDRLGLTRAISQDWGLDFDPLTEVNSTLETKDNVNWRTTGDAIAAIEEYAAELVEQLIQGKRQKAKGKRTIDELSWIEQKLLPDLQKTYQEIDNLLRGLDGKFVPSGASGAPTRGRSDVLPTGRNFYSVDIRAIPTETAWNVGRKAAEVLIDRYTQENGEYPQTLGLSVWGTSTMRTGGDDIAEALALLGVQPVWEGVSRRVIDFEILPLSVLKRPRIDVTLRISGFFRDAFPNLIDLFDSAVAAVANLDEPAEQNPLAAQVRKETQNWQDLGLTEEAAKDRSRYRIFGSKPGAYGAGLQGLIEAQNWTDDRDLATAYINWSSYAYTKTQNSNSQNLGGISAPEAFKKRLSQMQIVLHNQDNREHDLLDSDDYYQFQGGLTAAVRAISGKNPTVYFGDRSMPENPKVRLLQEEIARVYRSRVVNPKWIAGVMRHGYKGAFEMAATVDYLFAYDATANCVEDYIYQGVTEAYLFDSQVQEFIHQKNPWALRDMAERLLEANQRGLWRSASAETLEELRSIALHAEGSIESL